MFSLSSLESEEAIYRVRTKVDPKRSPLPITEAMLRYEPSGHLFGMSQDAAMGWDVRELNNGHVLILSTMGGVRDGEGFPIALGYHTGHWEVESLVKEAAKTLAGSGIIPFAAHCSDPCDGRTQGTAGMMDSLAYRNSAAETFGRLIRSLPKALGLIGVATCDKGLPAVMMAMAESRRLSGILIPGGVTLPPVHGEDAGKVQSLGARYAHGEITLREAAELGCSACASSGGGCQFFGTAASAQVLAEALGLALPHSALAPSGEPVWLESARQSAMALSELLSRGIKISDILSEKAFANAMAVLLACGASTNMLLHLPAVAFQAGVGRPAFDDWQRLNQQVPRIVDVLPNGPNNFKTVQMFLAGGVPEVLLHLRNSGFLHLDVLTCTGNTLGDNLKWWETSKRRQMFKNILEKQDGVSPSWVIMDPDQATAKKIGKTMAFISGNLAPGGAIVKATAISESLFHDHLYHTVGKARVFYREESAIKAIKSTGPNRIKNGEILVLLCQGPMGAGFPETGQVTFALKYTKAMENIPLITDGRFSGLSSGPCVGHVSPEALAGGPIGKVRDGDLISITIDRNRCVGQINLLEENMAERDFNPNLKPQTDMPASVKLWACLQEKSGGIWGGSVYDAEAITK